MSVETAQTLMLAGCVAVLAGCVWWLVHAMIDVLPFVVLIVSFGQ